MELDSGKQQSFLAPLPGTVSAFLAAPRDGTKGLTPIRLISPLAAGELPGPAALLGVLGFISALTRGLGDALCSAQSRHAAL